MKWHERLQTSHQEGHAQGMGRTGRLAALVAWVLGLVALLAVLLPVGGTLATPPLDPGGWGDWLAARTAEDAVMAIVRVVAIGLAGYLLLATALAVVLRLGDAGRLVTVAEVVTLPFVRGIVQAGLGVGLAGASVAAVGAGAGSVRQPTAAEVALASAEGVPVLERVDTPPPVLRRIDAVAPEPVADAATWTVAPGDHLWSVAERVLADAWGRQPAEAEVVPFWEAVVETNRPGLPDPANPDLLFPGQVLTLPAPPHAP